MSLTQAETSSKELLLPGDAFQVEGRLAFIFLPPEEKRKQSQPWIFYSPTLPAYPDVHEKWMHEQFLAADVAVTGIDVGEAYGSPCLWRSLRFQAQCDQKSTYNHFSNKR